MTDKLDMSLDDIIKLGKKSRGGGGRGGRSRGSRGVGAMRRNTRNFRSNRSTPYSRPKQLPNKWQHDLFDGGIGASPRSGRTGGGLSTGTKLHISNLDFGVSESDIEELFREFGKMKRSCVHYDASGRSHGTAEVVYQRREDALNAIKQYNGVPLDGRAMKIEMVSEPATNRQRETFRSQGSIGGSRGRSRGNRGRGRRGFGRGRSGGGSGNKRQSKTAEELDAELDAYHDQGDVDMLED